MKRWDSYLTFSLPETVMAETQLRNNLKSSINLLHPAAPAEGWVDREENKNKIFFD